MEEVQALPTKNSLWGPEVQKTNKPHQIKMGMALMAVWIPLRSVGAQKEEYLDQPREVEEGWYTWEDLQWRCRWDSRYAGRERTFTRECHTGKRTFQRSLSTMYFHYQEQKFKSSSHTGNSGIAMTVCKENKYTKHTGFSILIKFSPPLSWFLHVEIDSRCMANPASRRPSLIPKNVFVGIRRLVQGVESLWLH